MLGFEGEVLAVGMDLLAVRREDARDRVLGKPLDLETRDLLAELIRDGHVTPRVAEADRRRHVERASRPAHGAPPRNQRCCGQEEVGDGEIDGDRVTRVRGVARALHREEPSSGYLRQRGPDLAHVPPSPRAVRQ